MTIQDAIKSGKPFKRKTMLCYLHVEDDMAVFESYNKPRNMDEHYFLFISDILADDWEAEAIK